MARTKLLLRCSLLYAVLFLFQVSASAQFAPRIRTARPSVTMGTYTVGKDILQWQSGMRWRELHHDQIDQKIFQYKTVLRWGFAERWEMSGVINYQRDWIDQASTRLTHNGIHTLRLGLRHHLFEKEGFVKAAAIQGRFWIPFQQKDFNQKKMGGRIMASVSYRLLKKLQLITNGGWRWTGTATSPATPFFSLRFSHPLTSDLSLVFDYFSNFAPFEPDYAIGLGYYLTPLWKIDIAIGNLGESQLSNHYLEIGWATRLDWRG